mmetsp:Transcript_70245/g.154901  ORF Transcript_70245/g.154901 Transcript_70245/m.154901 type:complete len:258 (+) Transcript_70245:1461-2234(+)
MVASTVFCVAVPSPRAKPCSSFITLSAMALSRPLVASSAKSKVGSVSSSVAKARRRRSPPEMPAPMAPMRVFLHFAKPNSVMSASLRCTHSLLGKRPMRKRHWNSRCSRTVRFPKSCSSWKRKALCSRTSSEKVLPLIITSEPWHSGSSAMPASDFKRVDFPLPEGPMMANSSPGATLPALPSKIFTCLLVPFTSAREASTDRLNHCSRISGRSMLESFCCSSDSRRSSPFVSSSGAAPSNCRGWARRQRIKKAKLW